MEKKKLMEIFGGNDKKVKTDILTLAAVGVALIGMGGFLGGTKKEKEVPITETKEVQKSLENRLKEILSKVDGAGRVDVLITYKATGEKIVAKQIKQEDTSTDETATIGDERSIKSNILESSYVIVENSDGSEEPLILKEEEPEIEGVIIVAEGGGDVIVKNSLIKAVEAALGVKSHKIEVLKMKI